ncbi:hypothetical protein AKJ37_05280 [candidate division MSBL1 archaeon SCGC-AAA259I09]|uniref:Polymerase beta nucleotidyltransferase domain-containing protein n=2 Tax=candidate division MSBL1 TaxID=215777 RepID=A0A133UQD9_9EURY|nr:hypothetical protein AKJ37_05280 [candidate division MSBL1 archaeon SCGC-AAA259I09]KXA98502.1 hypothetical protein AKJ39_01780 [candidate division MSBL1 archaeon SCGC-AAA259J03]
MDKKSIEEDFSFLKQRRGVLAVLIYGSSVTGRNHGRSDIDVCIVAPDEDQWELWMDVDRKVSGKDKYDFHIFEDLGLRMKHRVMENHEVLWSRDEPRLQEYFYKYRELWKDQAKARKVA